MFFLRWIARRSPLYRLDGEGGEALPTCQLKLDLASCCPVVLGLRFKFSREETGGSVVLSAQD